MINTELIIVVAVTLAVSMLGMLLLMKDWETKGTKIRIYCAVMIVMQIATILLAKKFYPQMSACTCIRQMGLLAIIWQAAAHDYKKEIIPNKIILEGIIFRAVMLVPEFLLERSSFISNIVSDIIALLGITVVMFICLLLMKNSIGMGDVKLLMVMAATQGVADVCMAVFWSMIAAFFAAVFVLITRKKGRKDSLPFAPFLLIGTIVAFVMTGA